MSTDSSRPAPPACLDGPAGACRPLFELRLCHDTVDGHEPTAPEPSRARQALPALAPLGARIGRAVTVVCAGPFPIWAPDTGRSCTLLARAARRGGDVALFACLDGGGSMVAALPPSSRLPEGAAPLTSQLPTASFPPGTLTPVTRGTSCRSPRRQPRLPGSGDAR